MSSSAPDVTLRDVARKARVSPMTVSLAVNGSPKVRPVTRDKVMKVVTQMGYRPNLAARNLRAGRTGVITLGLPELSHGYYAELAHRIMVRAEQLGLTVLIESTRGERQRELALLSSDRLLLTDGLLLAPFGLRPSDMTQVTWMAPTVLVGADRIPNAPLDRVTIDNEGAARSATEHLIARGCRHIAVIGARTESDPGSATQRLRGYRQALDAAGLPYRRKLIARAERWHRGDGRDAVHELLALGTAFDGLFAFNDLLAFGAVYALQEHGRAVPGDVAVVGFDDLDEAKYAAPPLSSVDPGISEVADLALAALDRGMRTSRPDPSAEPPQVLHAPYEIVVRASTS